MSEIHSETDFEGRIPGQRDPVAALREPNVNVWPVTLDRLEKQGYVLVNEKRLAAALESTHLLDTAYYSGEQDFADLAAAILAAIQAHPTGSREAGGATDE